VGILVIIVMLLDGRREGVVVENVGGRYSTENGHGRSSGKGRSSCRRSTRNRWQGWLEGSSVDVIKAKAIEIMSEVKSITMGKDGGSGVFFINGFINSIGEFLLGSKMMGITKGGSPGECHVIDKRNGMIFLCSVRTGIKKEVLEWQYGEEGQIDHRGILQFCLAGGISCHQSYCWQDNEDVCL
jgi:hypothetical protein